MKNSVRIKSKKYGKQDKKENARASCIQMNQKHIQKTGGEYMGELVLIKQRTQEQKFTNSKENTKLERKLKVSQYTMIIAFTQSKHCKHSMLTGKGIDGDSACVRSGCESM